MNSVSKTFACTFLTAAAAFAAGPTKTTAGQMEMPKDEKSFLERVHHVNQMEIEMGTLVQDKQVSSEVKDFARKMVTEHRQADEQLMSFAKTNNLKIGEPKPMNDMERKVMEANKAEAAALKTLDGKMLESNYMAHMVAGHDATLMKLTSGVSAFPKTASLIQPIIPKVSEHRDQAYRILGTLKPQVSGVGGSGQMGSESEMKKSDSTKSDMNKPQKK